MLSRVFIAIKRTLFTIEFNPIGQLKSQIEKFIEINVIILSAVIIINVILTTSEEVVHNNIVT
jgi:hypothetical protein